MHPVLTSCNHSLFFINLHACIDRYVMTIYVQGHSQDFLRGVPIVLKQQKQGFEGCNPQPLIDFQHFTVLKLTKLYNYAKSSKVPHVEAQVLT